MIQRSLIRCCFAATWILGVWTHGAADAAEKLNGAIATPQASGRMPAEQTAKSCKAPEGFSVSVFAAEPDVEQPIGIATDSRGRVWVAENRTYAERSLNFDLKQTDRIIVLEDADGDGKAEKRKVFWDKAKKLTSVEIGFGGVWALCPPKLLFIPDRNGDDVPDGEPQVVLDGWDESAVRHNIANGLRWGPDGWLYGRHGILATSMVGAVGTSPSERTPISCGIWRYHPTRKTVEVVCRGTTNPWGMDWNEHGELFFINTVIGHLWHALPGAHFQRMYGEDADRHVYGLIGQTADHFHWDTAEAWHDIRNKGVSLTTDQAGGGHAHSGLMIYLGENWPRRYRGSMFTINFHGKRLNNDVMERRGAGYVGKHAPDLLRFADPWFRGIDLIQGADGGVFVADWSDTGECHDEDGVDRGSGRIYKIFYGASKPSQLVDVAKLSAMQLVDLVTSDNEWLVRQARKALQERAASGESMIEVSKKLRKLIEDWRWNDWPGPIKRPLYQLRALWFLQSTDPASENWLLTQPAMDNDHFRAWRVRILVDQGIVSSPTAKTLASEAVKESSGLVLLYLASVLQRMAPADRWELAEALAAKDKFATDPVIPLMLWYGVEPVVLEDPQRALRLAASSKVPLISQYIARRLTENIGSAMGPIDRLISTASESSSVELRRAILLGMTEALRGWRKAPVPTSWKERQAGLIASKDEATSKASRELGVVFGDGRAMQDLVKIAASKRGDMIARRDAIRVLVEARSKEAVPLLRELLTDRDLAPDAARGLAAFEEPENAALLVAVFPRSSEGARAAVVGSLSSRPAWAKLLLGAVKSGAIDRASVPAFQIRQMSAFPDESVRKQIASLWPELRELSVAKRQRIEYFKSKLAPQTLAKGDLSNGRRLFVKTCANCHTLYGQGGKIGPDLTGSQRFNIDYLLENIVDPAATIAKDYRMSTVALSDGRLLNGIVGDQSGPTIALQTATERLVIPKGDVEKIRSSDLSLMPEAALDVMDEAEIRDLIGYLMSSQQVPLPAGSEREAPSPAR